MGLSDGSSNHSILPIEYQANMVKRNTITLVSNSKPRQQQTDDGAILLRKARFEPRVLSSEALPDDFCCEDQNSLRY
ncbi:predicted protein [Histoplasma mississippiense (nom. inval.)]|uniref:predicted protein n=1 Tax=Ajellomyces capsulatus (strain NAm1 / WU24) TaxID=2059318 RepID=UPI000157CC66|nr:predicted protein [Histoplasma mississippiense (nom. inval.)]EDN10310.1 predicted protein [Histoplasma mississippiense (nom. inval.)]